MVILRKLNPSDAATLASIANNKKIADNLRDVFPHPYTLKDAEWFIQFDSNESPDHRWAIEYNSKLCGIIGLHVKEDVYAQNLEIGYWLGEEYWGKGIMTQAIQQVLKIGFEDLNCHRIYASVFDYNDGSRRVLEKAGFRNEGLLIESIYKNEGYHNEIRFGMTKLEYKKRG